MAEGEDLAAKYVCVGGDGQPRSYHTFLQTSSFLFSSLTLSNIPPSG
jgi:hypothetical protein